MGWLDIISNFFHRHVIIYCPGREGLHVALDGAGVGGGANRWRSYCEQKMKWEGSCEKMRSERTMTKRARERKMPDRNRPA